MYKKIGIVVAMTEELKDVVQIFGKLEQAFMFGSFVANKFCLNGKEIFIISSGIGNINAAMSTQLLIEKWGVEVVVNFGLAGGLCDTLKGQQELLVDKVVAYDFSINVADSSASGVLIGEKTPFIQIDYSAFQWLDGLGLKKVTCASADKFVNSAVLKADLIARYGASICEMEAYGVVSACKIYDVPCIMLKAISDMADENADKSLCEVKGGVIDFYKKSLEYIISNL